MNKENQDLENSVESLNTASRSEEDYHVVFEGNMNLSPNVATEEIPLEKLVTETDVIQVGNITSGKAFILSFTDSKYKQINQFPFSLRNGTETGNDKDEYYHYNHHWDLRQGHDIESISEEFPDIFPYENRGQYGFDQITEAQYTELIRYKVYLLIKKGEFVFYENDFKKIYVIWDGNEVRPPVWYIPFEWKDKDKEREIEVEAEEAVEELVEEADVALPVETVTIDGMEFEGGTGETEAEVAVAVDDAIADVDMGLNIEPVREFESDPVPVRDASFAAITDPIVKGLADPVLEVEKDSKDWETFSEENEDASDSNINLLDEVRRLDSKIRKLEQQLDEQVEKNKKYRTSIHLLVILSVVIASAGVAIQFFL